MQRDRGWLIYGTGRMASKLSGRAHSEGLDVTIAGRNIQHGQAIADEHGITFMELALDRPYDASAALERFTGIINTAGPFSATTRPILELCLKHGLSYVDLSNEHITHQAVWAASPQAREVGVTFVPGAGLGTLGAEILAREASAALGAIQEFFIVLPRRDARSSTPGVRDSAAHILASTPAEANDGEIRDLPTTGGIHRVDLPDGPATTVPIRNGDLEALSRTPGLGHVRVCARLNLPPWIARAALPTIRRRIRRPLVRARPHDGFPRYQEDARQASTPPRGASTLWAHARPEGTVTKVFGLEVVSGHGFAIESALDVIDAIEERRAAGTFSPLQILKNQSRYHTASRLLLP